MIRSMLTAAAVLCLSAAMPATARADGAEDFKKQCVSCHGADGKGQTKMGEKLKVQDLTDPKVQAKFTDEQAIKAITEGLKDENGKTTMPAKKDKLTPEQIKDVVAFVRTLKAG